ncbi:division/cell wall cluster transcriptional repressor MraZ [Olivibacter sitiensis]|uniref:division/cell wall cluster transcriptional repressor MraZ n=1 Tax=Olivibacter sitiensis TaxID=376470 RepID=UPI00048528CD|nr:division/cell wall cluster transcriptional repressor MraZ [Olivibacter sitiensis]
MTHFIGEFECKLDTKARMVLPAGLKKQMPEVERDGLVVNRGFEKHLVIYTMAEWAKKQEELSKLNTYDPKVREFIRKFTRGATVLSLDSANRVLLPKALMAYAGIQTDVVLACQFNTIEIWSKEEYEAQWENDSSENFSSLAAEVMGGKDI